MGWIGRLLKGNELGRAQLAAEEARERAEESVRELARWSAALGEEDRAVKATVHAHMTAAAAAAAKEDLSGWQEALAQLELARAACARGRAALARAQPRAAGLLLLAEASASTEAIQDVEDRSGTAGRIGALQARHGDLEGARATLARVGESADRAAVLEAIAIARGTPEAMEAFERELRALPDFDWEEWDTLETLLPIVQSQCADGDLAGARAWCAQLAEPERRDRALHAIVEVQAVIQRLDEARAIAAEIQDPRFAAAAQGAIAREQAVAGDGDGALRTAEGIEDLPARWHALGEIAGALAERGDTERALAVVDRIEDSAARDFPLTRIAEASVGRRDFDGALAVLARVHHGSSRAHALVRLAAALQVAGENERASEIFQQAFATAESAGGRSSGDAHALQGELASFLVFARAQMGEFEAAEAAANAVDDEHMRTELLGSLGHFTVQHPAGGIAALAELLARHPGAEERTALLESGATALLALKAASSAAPAPGS